MISLYSPYWISVVVNITFAVVAPSMILGPITMFIMENSNFDLLCLKDKCMVISAQNVLRDCKE